MQERKTAANPPGAYKKRPVTVTGEAEERRRVFLPIGGETDAARQKGAERGESVCVLRRVNKERQGRRLESVSVCWVRKSDAKKE